MGTLIDKCLRAEKLVVATSTLTVLLAGLTWSGPSGAASKLVVKAVKVEEACGYRWFATVGNEGSSASGAKVTAQAFQGKLKGGGWEAASGLRVDPIAPGASAKTKSIGFNRKPGKTHLRVELSDAGRKVSQKIIQLPAESPTKVAFVNTRFTADSYSVNVKNVGQQGLAGITIQAFSGPSRTGAWKPAGGGKPACIKPNASFTQKGGKPSNHPYIRIDVKNGDTVLQSTVLDSRRPPSGRGPIKPRTR